MGRKRTEPAHEPWRYAVICTDDNRVVRFYDEMGDAVDEAKRLTRDPDVGDNYEAWDSAAQFLPDYVKEALRKKGREVE